MLCERWGKKKVRSMALVDIWCLAEAIRVRRGFRAFRERDWKKKKTLASG